jgi:hypothetical protein
MTRICLLCKTSQDAIALTQVPVRSEGRVIGSLLVCAPCIEDKGLEQLKSLMQTAIDQKSYPPESFLSADSTAGESEATDNNGDAGFEEESEEELEAEIEVSPHSLQDATDLAERIGPLLGRLLHQQYRQGRGRVQLATSLVQEGDSFQFRVSVLPD